MSSRCTVCNAPRGACIAPDRCERAAIRDEQNGTFHVHQDGVWYELVEDAKGNQEMERVVPRKSEPIPQPGTRRAG